MKTVNSTCGLILLAAGGSSRLGSPKQLLEIDGKLLLQKSIDTVSGSLFYPKVLVLGAQGRLIKTKIDTKDFTVTFNHLWEKGISSSIQKGLGLCIEKSETCKSILIMLADQVEQDLSLLLSLLHLYEKKRGIVACRYANSIGVPAIFNESYFNDLRALKGDQGAKKILLQNQAHLHCINFSGGKQDIDTRADYQSYLEDRKN